MALPMTVSPAILRVGERKPRRGDRYAVDEYVFVPPGSMAVVAPRPKDEKPSLRNAVKALRNQLDNTPGGQYLAPLLEAVQRQLKPKKAQAGYVVQPGDTLWTIIQRLGGDPTQWGRVASAIGLSDPRTLQIGTVIPWDVLRAVGANVPAPPPPPPPPAPPPPAPSPAPPPAPSPPAQGTVPVGGETMERYLQALTGPVTIAAMTDLPQVQLNIMRAAGLIVPEAIGVTDPARFRELIGNAFNTGQGIPTLEWSQLMAQRATRQLLNPGGQGVPGFRMMPGPSL